MRIKDFLTTAILALTIICFGGENCAIQSTATDSSIKAAISTSIDTTESDTLPTDTTEESESETVKEANSTPTEGESSIAPTPIEAPATFIPSEGTTCPTENSTGAAAATSDTRLFTDSTNGVSTVGTTSGINGESQTTLTSTTVAATTQTTVVTTRPATTTTKKLTAYAGDAPKTGDSGGSGAFAGIALGAAVLTFLGFFGKKD